MRLFFESGTLLCCDAGSGFDGCGICRPDKRSGLYRARACDYAALVLELRRRGIAYTDEARCYLNTPRLDLAAPLTLRPHQELGLRQWREHGCRGVVSLPTGSGKTILAVAAVALLRRSALVLVPTIDLLGQWCSVLTRYFQVTPGILGGGEHTFGAEITVSTYDSAVLQMEFIGNRFGLLVADECHHLPAAETRLAAEMCIAPFRLGLSATPEMPDDRASVMRDLLGETVCSVSIGDLAGGVLSPYRVVTRNVRMLPDERARYDSSRRVYTSFLKSCRIDFNSPSDWGRFLRLCVRDERGRAAFAAYLEQRKLSRGSESKLAEVWRIIRAHRGERIIIFTADNDTAYDIGRRFCLPVITHHTRPSERAAFLDAFRSGRWPVLVTGQVLNEGVDVPAAGVGVVLSGTAAVREHVQRLGRILRPAAGKKQAVLYELISAGTGEVGVNMRRRRHQAYNNC